MGQQRVTFYEPLPWNNQYRHIKNCVLYSGSFLSASWADHSGDMEQSKCSLLSIAYQATCRMLMDLHQEGNFSCGRLFAPLALLVGNLRYRALNATRKPCPKRLSEPILPQHHCPFDDHHRSSVSSKSSSFRMRLDLFCNSAISSCYGH